MAQAVGTELIARGNAWWAAVDSNHIYPGHRPTGPCANGVESRVSERRGSSSLLPRVASSSSTDSHRAARGWHRLSDPGLPTNRWTPSAPACATTAARRADLKTWPRTDELV